MPERRRVRVDMAAEQGEGAFVLTRPLPWSLQKLMGATGELANEQVARELLALVVDWNLVDDAGQPLPLPADDPNVIEKLTIPEVLLIARQVAEDVKAASSKN